MKVVFVGTELPSISGQMPPTTLPPQPKAWRSLESAMNLRVVGMRDRTQRVRARVGREARQERRTSIEMRRRREISSK